MSDLKMQRNAREAKTAARPKLSINQYHGTVYGVRATEYGADKYARGNYHGSPPAGVDPYERASEYVDAALRHLGKVAQAINVARGTGGDLAAAIACLDDDSSGGFPPSMLPHIAHAIAGLKILVECGVHDGYLPVDPGQPWKAHPMYAEVQARRSDFAKAGLVQKVDPDAERRRVEELRASGALNHFPHGQVANERLARAAEALNEQLARGAETEKAKHQHPEYPPGTVPL